MIKMITWKKILILTFINIVSSQSDFNIMPAPCPYDDYDCITAANTRFLKMTCGGLPKYGILPLDPYILPSLDVPVNDNVVLHLRNLVVTGLRDQQLTDFVIDPIARRSSMELLADDIKIIGAIDVELINVGKTFSGLYRGSCSAQRSMIHEYNISQRDDDDFFEVGTEDNNCELVGKPEVSISDFLEDAIQNDSDARSVWSSCRDALDTIVIERILNSAYSNLDHNMQTIARLYPKKYFFSNA